MQKKHLFGYPIVTLLAFGIGASSASTSAVESPAASATATQPAPTVTRTAAPETPVASTTTTAAASVPPSPAAIPGDGTYEVGVDIQPGKYASGTPASGNCYWARLSSDEPFDGILANNNSAGKSVVVIKKSDKYFQSSGCSDWTKR